MKHSPKPASSRAASIEREALRTAIARKTEAEARIDKLVHVLSAETERKYAASNAVDTAESALALARAHEAGDNVRKALGEEPESPLTVLEAQRAVEHAQADWKALHALCEGISERIEAERNSFQYVEKAVDDAVKSVVSSSPEGRAVVTQYCETLTALAAVEKTLHALLDFLSPELRERAMQHHIASRDGFRKLAPDPKWIAAIAALRRDADSPLPA